MTNGLEGGRLFQEIWRGVSRVFVIVAYYHLDFILFVYLIEILMFRVRLHGLSVQPITFLMNITSKLPNPSN
jgi:hypothetical protein